MQRDSKGRLTIQSRSPCAGVRQICICKDFPALFRKPPSRPSPLQSRRFEIKYETSLKEPLVQLGVTKPFDTSGPSDLTRLADEDGAPVTNLVVSDVIHKTYIKVHRGREGPCVLCSLVLVDCCARAQPCAHTPPRRRRSAALCAPAPALLALRLS